MVCESTEMRILATCNCAVPNGFCFASYDPSFQLLGELTVGILGSIAGNRIAFSQRFATPICLAASGCFIATEFVAIYVNAQMMLTIATQLGHCDAVPGLRRNGASLWSAFLGIVEEPGLGPLATADVGLGWKLTN